MDHVLRVWLKDTTQEEAAAIAEDLFQEGYPVTLMVEEVVPQKQLRILWCLTNPPKKED